MSKQQPLRIYTVFAPTILCLRTAPSIDLDSCLQKWHSIPSCYVNSVPICNANCDVCFDTGPDPFACKPAFVGYVKYEGDADVAQCAAPAWDSGYRSIDSIGHASEDELLSALGEAALGAERIHVFHSFFKAHAGKPLVTGVA